MMLSLLMLVLGCSSTQTMTKLQEGETVEVPAGTGYFVGESSPEITTFALLSAMSAGDLVITELMHTPLATPYDSYGEWIELYNASGVAIDLNGLELSSSGDTGLTFGNSLVVASGDYVLLGTRSGQNGGLTYDGLYSSASVRLGINDSVTISFGGTTFDTVSWISSLTAITDGRSFSLDGDDLDATINDSEFRWYAGQTTYGDGDFGTPGGGNPVLYMGNELGSGDLVITEIMQNPEKVDDFRGEWFEVINRTDGIVQLNGLRVDSTSDLGFTVTANAWFAPDSLALFASNGNAGLNGGLPTVDVVWPSTDFVLAQTDTVTLTGAGLVDQVSYDKLTWGYYTGVSLSLTPVATDDVLNDNGDMWCPTSNTYGLGDYGTPKSTNIDCPYLDFDGDGITIEDGDCDDTDPTIGTSSDPEVCDGIDNDCNGLTDDDDPGITYEDTDLWYLDNDHDGYGIDSAWTQYACEEPFGPNYLAPPFVQNDLDCDDGNAGVFPGAAENESTSDCLTDEDEDGWSAENTDCDDADATSTIVADDSDCDAVLAVDDCDDTDASNDSVCVELDLGLGFALDMVLIPAGIDPQDRYSLSSDFYMMNTEVTQGMFNQMMGYQSYDGYSNGYGAGDDYPAYYVNWHMAADFANQVTQTHNTANGTSLQTCYTCTGSGSTSVSCTEVGDPYACTGYLLPTEAEWEYAARSGSAYDFWTPDGGGHYSADTCTGDESIMDGDGEPLLSDYVWYCGNASTVQVVAQKKPNDFGLYDMHGSLYELMNEIWGCNFPNLTTDPNCDASYSSRVIKGGYWGNKPSLTGTSFRNSINPTTRNYGVGFRLVLHP